ncbi:efflux transporter outer membrane subunit [Variovorax ginsengisoli]|uniref:Multidrug efflux system outer membrane protein n=1 Tax=Variovorax ginsengisoli TaxID=363844 RepID=A0ABT9S8Q5_9BURK|nr:TolC family protein [Variovorax ginsengisoli]MDP9900730.1 multidrug efflux system outer membrane protein [Variovorax ginsengisoli]
MKKNFQLPGLLVAVGMLTGCAVGPRYETPAVPTITLASPQQNQFSGAADQAPWWTFLEEEHLTLLVDAALAHNHDIRRAQASLLASRAVFDQQQLDRYPAVTAQGGYQRSIEQRVGVTGEPVRSLAESWRAGFDVQWEIDLFGRLNRLSRSANARADAAQADLALVRLTVAADVARYYYEGQGLQRRLDLAQVQVENWRGTLALLQSRVRAGNGPLDELENARAQLALSEATIAPLVAARDQAQYRLDVLIGQRPGQNPVAASMLKPAPLARELPLGDVDELIRQRPDVVRAERLLAASTEDVGAATAELYPRLDLGGFIGFFALRGADAGIGSRAFEIAPSLTWPAMRMGGARARLRGARALTEGALARYEQALLQAQEDVENAVTQLARHQQRLLALLQSASHSERALDIAMSRYHAGAGSYLAVLENQRGLSAVQQEATQAETASYLHVIALYKALGWGVGMRTQSIGVVDAPT